MDFKQTKSFTPSYVPWHISALFTYASTAVAETLLFPLESSRFRLQMNGKFDNPAYSSLRDTISQTTKQIGFTGLYRGLGLTLLRELCFIFPKAYSYEVVKRYFAADIQKVGYYRRVLPLMCASTVGLMTCNALDVIRIKYITDVSVKPRQSARVAMKNLMDVFGAPGVFKGLLMNFFRSCFFMSAELASYEQTKIFLLKKRKGSKEAVGIHIISSVTASTAACLAACPFDVLRTRFMNQVGEKNTYPKVRHCILDIVRNDGVKTFYRGFVPLLLKTIPSSLVFFTLMENLKDVYLKSMFT